MFQFVTRDNIDIQMVTNRLQFPPQNDDGRRLVKERLPFRFALPLTADGSR